jgi:hypothetical protein
VRDILVSVERPGCDPDGAGPLREGFSQLSFSRTWIAQENDRRMNGGNSIVCDYSLFAAAAINN